MKNGYTVCIPVLLCLLLCGCTQNIPLNVYSVFGLSKKEFPAVCTYRALAFDDKNQHIYAINNTARTIDLLDNSGRTVLSIGGFVLNGKDETYSNISDISVQGGRLYAASSGSCRVDIYSIPDNRILMSLGTGSWQGDQSNAVLVHPKGVLATDKYVFVASQSNYIAVYLQSDIVPGNHKKARKYAFLKLEESLRQADRTYMEVIDNRLYVTDEGKDRLYVFDIADIRQSDTAGAIAPVSVTVKPAGRRMHGMSFNGSYICTAQQGGYLAFYTLNDFSVQNFNSPAAVFTDIQSEKFGNAKNVYLRNNILFFTTDAGTWKTEYREYPISAGKGVY